MLPDASVQKEASQSFSLSEENSPDFESTVPAELWSELSANHSPATDESLRSAAEPIHTRRAQSGPQYDDKPFLDSSSWLHRSSTNPVAPTSAPQVRPVSNPFEGTEFPARSSPGRPEATIGNAASGPEASKQELPGYELPGSQDDDESDDWPLFADSSEGLPTHMSLQAAAEPVPHSSEADALDPVEQDLAHFISEFSDRQDSAVPQPRAAGRAPFRVGDVARERREPTLDVSQPLSPDDQHRPPEDALWATHEDTDWQLLDSDAAVAASAFAPQSAQYREIERDHAIDEPLVDSEWDEEAEIESQPEEAAAAIPSFVRRARRRAFWSGIRVRATLWSAALGLVILLLGQAAIHHRDLIAASFPQTQAALVSLCEPLHCEVRPNRDIGAILVDGSSFNRTQGDRYQFLLTLRNRSQREVRAPVIELTLTDVQDQPVVRRVLQADELNLPAVFQPQQEWSGEMPMIMAPGTARIAGYRVLAFYPH